MEQIPSTGDRGAVGELIVAANLLSMGASVFRSVSPNAPFDLVVLWEDELYPIEVRTAHKGKNGTYSFAGHGSNGAWSKSKIFAINAPPLVLFLPNIGTQSTSLLPFDKGMLSFERAVLGFRTGIPYLRRGEKYPGQNMLSTRTR